MSFISTSSKFIVCWHQSDHFEMRGHNDMTSAGRSFDQVPGWTKILYDVNKSQSVRQYTPRPIYHHFIGKCVNHCHQWNQWRSQEEERTRLQRQIQERDAALQRERQLRQQQQAEEKARRIRDGQARMRALKEFLAQTQKNTTNLQRRLEEEKTKLDSIHAKLMKEQTARSRFELPDGVGNCKKIVLIGDTGDGKSTLANILTTRSRQGRFATSDGFRSETHKIQSEFVQNGGHDFCIVDTPGGSDSDGRDRIHATDLVDFLHGIGQIDAFVWVRNLAKRRLAEGEQGFLRSMTHVLGEAFWQNVVVVFTHVDDGEEMSVFDRVSAQFPDEINRALGFHGRELGRMDMIPIGKHNFGEQSQKIFDGVIRCNNGRGFSADGLVAPVEERQREYDDQLHVCEETERELAELVAKGEDLAKECATLDTMIASLVRS